MKEQHTGANSSSVIKVGEVIFSPAMCTKKGHELLSEAHQ